MHSRSLPGQWCKAVLECMYSMGTSHIYQSHICNTQIFEMFMNENAIIYVSFAENHTLGVLLPSPVQQGSKIGNLICIWREKKINSNQIKSKKWTSPRYLVNIIPQRFCGALPVCDLALLLDLKSAASSTRPCCLSWSLRGGKPTPDWIDVWFSGWQDG